MADKLFMQLVRDSIWCVPQSGIRSTWWVFNVRRSPKLPLFTATWVISCPAEMAELPLSSIPVESSNTTNYIPAAGVEPEGTTINFMSNLIPDIRGPKLAPFQGDLKDIEFVRLLGPEQGQTLSPGSLPHSKVFQVKIKRRNYALKIFNFFTLNELRPFVYGGEALLTDDIVRHHLDPFYAECRAFGLLVEKMKDDTLAVRCHGYTFLPATLERRIYQQFGISDWNRHLEHEGQQLRAIFKDYIVYNSVCGRKTFLKMKENVVKLNQIGIYNMDIREDNYRGGRLFDFSLAITSPHISLSLKLRSRKNIELDMGCDVEYFEDMEKRIRERRKEEEEEEEAQTQGFRRQLRKREKKPPKFE